jgi:hypothetical protein
MRMRHLGPATPITTMVVVSRLARLDFMMEIEPNAGQRK